MKTNLIEKEQAVFVIDMNNGFCEEGALADKGIKRIVPEIIQIIRNNMENNGALFIVNDKHTKDSVELKRYPEHCHTEEESRTIKELKIYEEYADALFYKNSTCALFAPNVMPTLISMTNLKRVVIVGCCTDICIKNFAIALRNFFDEINCDVEVVVYKDAVETFDNDLHKREECNEVAFQDMENSGIKLVRSKEREGR